MAKRIEWPVQDEKHTSTHRVRCPMGVRGLLTYEAASAKLERLGPDFHFQGFVVADIDGRFVPMVILKASQSDQFHTLSKKGYFPVYS